MSKKSTTRKAVSTRSRTTRTQASREETPVREEAISFETDSALPDIPAREGYDQRWIRVRANNQDDAKNIYTASRRGWTPRSPGTVGKAQNFLCIQREGLGGVVGTHDMVLMERPHAISRKEAEVRRGARRGRTEAVKGGLFSEYKNLGTSEEHFTRPSVESSNRVERGRPVIQDD